MAISLPNKNILFTILVLLFFTQISVKAQNNYSVYHTNISKAEQLITQRQFLKALEIYEQTFEKFDFVFLRDYRIASQLAFYVGDRTKGMKYLLVGISKGWTIKSIKNNRLLIKQLDKANWDVIDEKYKSLREAYLKSLNKNRRQEFHEMIKKDQWLALGALFRIGEKSQTKYAEKKFAPNSEKQIQRIKEIAKSESFPGEKTIGLGGEIWVSTILVHNNSISKSHNLKDSSYVLFRSMMLKAVDKGEISPFTLALTENWRAAVNSEWKEKSYGYLTEKITVHDAKRANVLRKEIGLRSIELRNNLIDLQKETNIKFYLPDWPGLNKKIKIIP